MSALRVVVGGVVISVISFVLGRVSSAWPETPAAPPEPVVASWDGGALLTNDFELQVAALSPTGADVDPKERGVLLASLARQSFLASVARSRGLERRPNVRNQCEAALVDALRTDTLSSVTEPTEAELKAVYDAERDRYSQHETVKLAHIQLNKEPEGQRRAESLLKELSQKAKSDFYAFSDAALQHSIDNASKLAGGELAPLDESAIVSLFGEGTRDALRTLEPGAMLPRVVVTDQGLHLIRLVQRFPASTTPFERVRDTIASRMRAERTARAWERSVQELESSVGFRIVTP